MAALQFKGKNIVWNHHMSVPYHTLELDDKLSYNQDKAEGNLIIEGDNLPALKSLLPVYSGRIDCIYIDPPYNTGQEKWEYNDNVNSPLIKEWVGKVVGIDDLTRHDKWLSMMTPRLKLMRELMSEKGVLFISIDNNEQANLKLLCDEIFGEESFVNTLHLELSTTMGMKVGAAKLGNIVKNGEYVLVYSRDGHKDVCKSLLYDTRDFDSHFSIYYDSKTKEYMPLIKKMMLEKELNLEINNSKSKNIVNLYEGNEVIRNYILRNADKIFQNGNFDVNLSEKEEQSLEVETPTTIIREKREYIVVKNKLGTVRQLMSLSSLIGKADDYHRTYGLRKIRGDFWKGYYLDMVNINKEGDVDFSNGKKPVRLVKDLLKMVGTKDSLVLDAFAGSGTTAQAVLELNEEDKGNRKFILIQMPENSKDEPNKNICKDITRERVVKVIEKKLENKEVGFEYKRVGQPIDAETILSGQLPSYKELAKYVFYLATGQSPKDKDIDEKKYLAGKIDHTEVYLLYTPDMDKLRELALNFEWARDISKGNDNKKIVYAPACFMDDEYLEQFNMKFVSIPYNLFEREK